MNLDLWAARTKEINDAIESGEIETASRDELVKFNTWLCHPNAGMCFAKNYSQVSETVRLHMLRSIIDAFENRSKKTARWVMALAVASLIGTAAQVWYAYKSDKKSEEDAQAVATRLQQLESKLAAPSPSLPTSSGQSTKKAQ